MSSLNIARAFVACAIASLIAGCTLTVSGDGINETATNVSNSQDVKSGDESGWLSMASSSRPLDGGASSVVDLVELAMDAFESHDTTALERLLIRRDEFVDIIYPELGLFYASARDTRIETKQFLWENQDRNSQKGLRKALREVGRKRMRVIDVRFEGGVKTFRTYKLHEGTQVIVRTERGTEATLLALGSIVERDGRFKLMSYRDIN